ncbi:MAG: M48 family metalloprotease [Allosphingosinicella sp.]
MPIGPLRILLSAALFGGGAVLSAQPPAAPAQGAAAAPGSPRDAALAAAPARQAPAPGSTLRQADARVAAVAYRLASAGAPLCTVHQPLTGLLFHHLAEYAPADRPAMIARHGLDRGPGILTVLEGSPAAEAGLIAGDVLLAVNGRAFESGARPAAERKRKRWRERTDAAERQLEDALRAGPATLRLLREGRELTVTLRARPACPGRVRLARSSQVNAFANGRTVVMTTAMLDFLASDDELAIVLGHEMSHNILGHPSSREDEGLLAGLGIEASAKWKREEAADRFGLRLAHAGGYDLDAAIPFWRRYLGKYDWFPQIFRSHPSLGARERIASEEIAAIRAGAATAGRP